MTENHIIPNIKRCSLCQGSVNRICSGEPDKHFLLKTLHFECTSCGAIGDPATGMVVDLSRDPVGETYPT